MARPLKEGISYFPLDVDFLRDKKWLLLKAEFGAKGILIAIEIMCQIYGENGYYKKWDEDDCYLMSQGVGCDCSPQLISEVVLGCVRRGLFNESVFNAFSILTSEGIQRRYIRCAARKDTIKIIKEFFLLDIDDPTDVPIGTRPLIIQKSLNSVFTYKNEVSTYKNPEKVSNNPQNKINESKVNKSKEREYISSPKTKIFSPPSINEVEQYCKLKGYKLNGKTFISYYAAKGWKIGNTPMENWQAAVDSWASRDDEEKSKNYKNTTSENNAFLLAPNREYPTDMLNAMFEQTGEEI